MKTNVNLKPPAYHPVLDEIRDQTGVWHTGWLPFGKLADLIGTTTADLLRRLVILGVVEHREGRHRLTKWAKRKSYGTIYRRKGNGNLPRLEVDVILPQGMVLVVRNLAATNLPLTETERLRNEGLSLRSIAVRQGITLRAVQKRLEAIPPKLQNWPIVGTWEDDTDDLSACAV
ncbi:hypothetical protein [Agrobacterium sp. NPDC090273]|uniref:hypothetical protein n=1 Tax=Agrobacterium sp. NPDC090273 TaxID=3363919 RepID=UPI00383A9714